jgi:hypothetical protein
MIKEQLIRTVTIGILFLLGFCMLDSCSGRREIRKEMRAFVSNRIEVPQDMDYVYCGGLGQYRDTARQAKLIVYYDTLSCQSCSVNHIGLLRPLIERSRKTGKFDVLVIFSPRPDESAEVTTQLMVMKLDFPVCVDTYGSFRRKNNFIPADVRFHTFLVDRRGKPIFVGNPLDSDELSKLFDKVLQKI